MSKIIDDPEVATVALAAMTKMVALLAAELVVGQHSDDMDLLEAAIRAKLFASVEGISPEATAAGIALAHRLVNPVLRDLRLRTEAKAVGETHATAASSKQGKKTSQPRKLN